MHKFRILFRILNLKVNFILLSIYYSNSIKLPCIGSLVFVYTYTLSKHIHKHIHSTRIQESLHEPQVLRRSWVSIWFPPYHFCRVLLLLSKKIKISGKRYDILWAKLGLLRYCCKAHFYFWCMQTVVIFIMQNLILRIIFFFFFIQKIFLI